MIFKHKQYHISDHLGSMPFGIIPYINKKI